jgi:hypothetical protein
MIIGLVGWTLLTACYLCGTSYGTRGHCGIRKMLVVFSVSRILCQDITTPGDTYITVFHAYSTPRCMQTQLGRQIYPEWTSSIPNLFGRRQGMVQLRPQSLAMKNEECTTTTR